MLLAFAMLIAVTLLAIGWKAVNAIYDALQPSLCTWCGQSLEAHVEKRPC
jgi:hypothetical protein